MSMFGVEFESDPRIKQLEDKVFGELGKYITVENTPITNTRRGLPSDNKLVTPEDALRELKELQEKGLI